MGDPADLEVEPIIEEALVKNVGDPTLESTLNLGLKAGAEVKEYRRRSIRYD